MSAPDLLDVIAETDHECVVHAITPDMACACGVGLLDAMAGCDKRGHMHLSARDWHKVTCVWCHSLGAAWYRETCRRLQDRQAVAA